MESFTLHVAAKKGDIANVRHFFEIGLSVDDRDDCNLTPLHYAAKFGHLDVGKFLIDNESDLNAKAPDGKTALLFAAKSGKFEIVELLLKSGADASACDNKKLNVLHFICMKGCLRLAQYLVNEKYDLNARTSIGSTALSIAARKANRELFDLLRRAGADMKCRTKKNETVLHYASQNGWTDVVQYFMNDKWSIDLKTSDGRTPLMLAAEFGQSDIVRLLLECGADASVRGTEDQTVLHFACSNGSIETVQCIIKYAKTGLGVQAATEGTTIQCGLSVQTVNESMPANCGLDVQTPKEETSVASGLGVQMVNAGTPVVSGLGVQIVTAKTPTNYGQTVAEKSDTRYSLDDQVHEKSDINCSLDIQTVHEKSHTRCSLDDQTDTEETPLLVAARLGHKDIVNLLIDSGANEEHHDNLGMGVLLYACENGWLDVARKVTKICSLSELNECETLFYGTPLSKACANGYYDIVQHLLESGASLDGDEHQPFTVFDHLLHQPEPNLKCVDLIIKNGYCFEHLAFENLYRHPVLKGYVLANVDLCTQAIINKFNKKWLPRIHYFPWAVETLPPLVHRLSQEWLLRKGISHNQHSPPPLLEMLAIGGESSSAREETAKCVENEIRDKTFCIVMKIQPIVLQLLAAKAVYDFCETFKNRA